MADAAATTDTPSARIFAAAGRCFRRDGIANTTIEDIAVEAQMSRATVYRHVPGGRDEIVLAVAVAEVSSSLRSIVERGMGKASTFEDRCRWILLAVHDAIVDDLGFQVMFSPRSLGELATVAGYGEAAVALIADVARPLLDAARRSGELRADLTDTDVSEWLFRQTLALQLVKIPVADERARVEWLVSSFVVPPLLTGAS